jgi:hypothetical protein
MTDQREQVYAGEHGLVGAKVVDGDLLRLEHAEPGRMKYYGLASNAAVRAAVAVAFFK